MADELAEALDEVLAHAEKSDVAKTGATRYSLGWRDLWRVRLYKLATEASSTHPEAAGSDDPLSRLPREGTPRKWELGSWEYHPGEMLDLSEAICAQKEQELFDLWRSGVSSDVWKIISGEKMGWQKQGSKLRLLRKDVCIYEAEADYVRENLRQRISLAAAMSDRVDRLRICGNGVVPVAGALAFLSLWSRFEI